MDGDESKTVSIKRIWPQLEHPIDPKTGAVLTVQRKVFTVNGIDKSLIVSGTAKELLGWLDIVNPTRRCTLGNAYVNGGLTYTLDSKSGICTPVNSKEKYDVLESDWSMVPVQCWLSFLKTIPPDTVITQKFPACFAEMNIHRGCKCVDSN